MNNIEVKFYIPGEIPDEKLKYAVIAARYGGGWIFCRHKGRSTWEIPGGHREAEETIEEAARRELFEETGAVDFDLKPVSVYGVDSYGMLYFAEIKRIDSIPETSEIAEICYLESLPDNLTYPEIQPRLLREVNGWLCNRTSKGELWDIYDIDRNKTGKVHRRGEILQKGDYHLVVHIWIRNSRGEYLITKRAPHKGWPNMWECTGGSALAGDDSLSAALREVKEETGLELSPKNGRIVHTYIGNNFFADIWLFTEDHDLSEVVLQEGETIDKMLANAKKIREMLSDGTFIDYSYIEKILDIE